MVEPDWGNLPEGFTRVFAARAGDLDRPAFRAAETDRLDGALAELPAIFSELPPVWTEGAPDFDIDAVATILNRHRSPDFWTFLLP